MKSSAPQQIAGIAVAVALASFVAFMFVWDRMRRMRISIERLRDRVDAGEAALELLSNRSPADFDRLLEALRTKDPQLYRRITEPEPEDPEAEAQEEAYEGDTEVSTDDQAPPETVAEPEPEPEPEPGEDYDDETTELVEVFWDDEDMAAQNNETGQIPDDGADGTEPIEITVVADEDSPASAETDGGVIVVADDEDSPAPTETDGGVTVATDVSPTLPPPPPSSPPPELPAEAQTSAISRVPEPGVAQPQSVTGEVGRFFAYSQAPMVIVEYSPAVVGSVSMRSSIMRPPQRRRPTGSSVTIEEV